MGTITKSERPNTVVVRHLPVRRNLLLLLRPRTFVPGPFANLHRLLTPQNYYEPSHEWIRRSVKASKLWQLLIAEAPPATVTVPNVVGETTQNATFALSSIGLKANITYTLSALPPNTVISQSPLPGSLVLVRSVVNLIAVAYYTVPNVIGQTEANATTILSSAGFAPTFITGYSSFPAGEVFAQSLVAGTLVNATPVPNSYPITISVSLGPNLYMQVDEARNLVVNAGFNVTLQYTPSPTVPAGYVISQTPPGGTVAPLQGTVVTLLVSDGPTTPQGSTIMPSVIGLFAQTAAMALDSANISLDRYLWAISSQPEGTVIAQSILAGNLVVPGTIVQLTLSQGTAQPTQIGTIPTV